MKNLLPSIVTSLAILLISNNVFAQDTKKLPKGTIERKSKGLDAVIKKNAKVEVIAVMVLNGWKGRCGWKVKRCF